MLASTLLTTLFLALPALAFPNGAQHEQSRSRARSHNKRMPADIDLNVETTLEKRASYSGRATFYDVGLGACGGYNVASDYIVAQNSQQYGGGCEFALYSITPPKSSKQLEIPWLTL